MKTIPQYTTCVLNVWSWHKQLLLKFCFFLVVNWNLILCLVDKVQSCNLKFIKGYSLTLALYTQKVLRTENKCNRLLMELIVHDLCCLSFKYVYITQLSSSSFSSFFPLHSLFIHILTISIQWITKRTKSFTQLSWLYGNHTGFIVLPRGFQTSNSTP